MSDNKIVAGHVVPAGISDDLAAGIRRYAEEIGALGGYGTRVRATMPDGVEREGRLIEAGYGGCQPALETDEGRRYVIRDLAGARRVRCFNGGRRGATRRMRG